jgi:hypothetical protein
MPFMQAGETMRKLTPLIVLAGLALTPQANAASPGTALDNYCSSSTSYCSVIVRESSRAIEFRLRTRVHRGLIKICVAKRRTTCHSYRLKTDQFGVPTVKALWKHFPYHGRGTYAVAFFNSGHRVGAVLHFYGTPAGR